MRALLMTLGLLVVACGDIEQWETDDGGTDSGQDAAVDGGDSDTDTGTSDADTDTSDADTDTQDTDTDTSDADTDTQDTNTGADSETEDTDTADTDTGTACPEGALLDEATGLCWQVTPADGAVLPWVDAVTYCNDLGLGDFTDWRLPDLDELRSIVRGCSGNETGGSCTATDGCLTASCWSDTLCPLCTLLAGPSSGCYWEDGLGGSCAGGSTPAWNGYWTSNAVADNADDVWLVIFGYGGRPGFTIKTTGANARCVRGPD